MTDLIWFSVPGAMLGVMLIAIRPSLVGSEARAAAWVIIVPLLGFCLHQSFRVLFEWSGGFSGRRRAALEAIVKLGEAMQPPMRLSWNRAFLVWEVTFYGGNFPAPFREHDRGAWHYVLSFWSGAASAVLAAGLGGASLLWAAAPAPNYVESLASVELGAALVFLIKGRQTYRSLLAQEAAVVRVHAGLFEATIQNLSDVNRSA